MQHFGKILFTRTIGLCKDFFYRIQKSINYIIVNTTIKAIGPFIISHINTGQHFYIGFGKNKTKNIFMFLESEQALTHGELPSV